MPTHHSLQCNKVQAEARLDLVTFAHAPEAADPDAPAGIVEATITLACPKGHKFAPGRPYQLTLSPRPEPQKGPDEVHVADDREQGLQPSVFRDRGEQGGDGLRRGGDGDGEVFDEVAVGLFAGRAAKGI